MSIVGNARKETSRAIREGILVRPKRCSSCKNDYRLDAHHKDYFKPLDVMWLCRHCHLKWHAKNSPPAGSDLSFLAIRIESRGVDWHFPQKHVLELKRQIAESGCFMGPDGPLKASPALCKHLGLRAITTTETHYERVK